MTDIEVLEQMVDEGLFKEVEKGSDRAASYFARLFAYRANPTGRGDSWGCLTKPAGGKNIEGYSEDAVVKTNNPGNLNNVVDLVIGAGQAGARLNKNLNAFNIRRASDVWEAPRPLTTEELRILRPEGTGNTNPAPSPTKCEFKTYDDAQVKAKLDRLEAMIAQLADKLQPIDVKDLTNRVDDISRRLSSGLSGTASARFIGTINFTVKG